MPKTGDVFNPYRVFQGIFIPEAIVSFNELLPNTKLCWGQLARHAGKDGKCYPSRKALANSIGVSLPHVHRLIQQLVDYKLIRVIKPTGKDRLQHKHATYEFLWHNVFRRGTSGGVLGDTSVSVPQDTSSRSKESSTKKRNKGGANALPVIQPPLRQRRVKTAHGEPILKRPPPVYDVEKEVRFLLSVLNGLEQNYSNIGKPRNFMKQGRGVYFTPLSKIVKYLWALRSNRVNSIKSVYRDYLVSVYNAIERYGYQVKMNQFQPTDKRRVHFEQEWIKKWEEEEQDTYWQKKRQPKGRFDSMGRPIK